MSEPFFKAEDFDLLIPRQTRITNNDENWLVKDNTKCAAAQLANAKRDDELAQLRELLRGAREALKENNRVVCKHFCDTSGYGGKKHQHCLSCDVSREALARIDASGLLKAGP